MFVVVGAAFSTIRKINEAVLYILVVEFPCGKILMKSSIERLYNVQPNILPQLMHIICRASGTFFLESAIIIPKPDIEHITDF